MDVEDAALLVEVVEEYKTRCEALQQKVEQYAVTIERLEKQLAEMRDNEKENIQLIADLEVTVCQLDRELVHANAALHEAEEECALLSRQTTGDIKAASKRSSKENNHFNFDAELDALEQKLADSMDVNTKLETENKKLRETILARDNDIQQMDREIAKLREIIRERDAELSTKSSHSGRSGSAYVNISGRSQGTDSEKSGSVSRTPSVDGSDPVSERARVRGTERSTSFEEYLSWNKSKTENGESQRSKTRALLFDPNSEHSPLNKHTPSPNNFDTSKDKEKSAPMSKHKTPPPETPPRELATAGSSHNHNTTRKHKQPEMSPPIALDLSHINLTPKRHSYSGGGAGAVGSSPSTASVSSHSPYLTPKDNNLLWAAASGKQQQQQKDDKQKFKSMFGDSDTDNDVQVSPLPVRRRPQSRSLSSFQDLFQTNSNHNFNNVNPKKQLHPLQQQKQHGTGTRSEGDILTAPNTKSELLRDSIFTDSNSDDEKGATNTNNGNNNNTSGSKFYRSSAGGRSSNSKSSSSSSSSAQVPDRWASGGRNHLLNESYTQRHLYTHNESKEEPNRDDEISESDIKLGVHAASARVNHANMVTVTKGSAVVHTSNGSSLTHGRGHGAATVLPAIDQHTNNHATTNELSRNNSKEKEIAVTKSNASSSSSSTSLISGLMVGKSKRTIIPMGGSNT